MNVVTVTIIRKLINQFTAFIKLNEIKGNVHNFLLTLYFFMKNKFPNENLHQ